MSAFDPENRRARTTSGELPESGWQGRGVKSLDANDPNHALLVGEVAGALSLHFEDVRMEANDEGTGYTGRTLIKRPSGTWIVTVEKAPE